MMKETLSFSTCPFLETPTFTLDNDYVGDYVAATYLRLGVNQEAWPKIEVDFPPLLLWGKASIILNLRVGSRRNTCKSLYGQVLIRLTIVYF